MPLVVEMGTVSLARVDDVAEENVVDVGDIVTEVGVLVLLPLLLLPCEWFTWLLLLLLFLQDEKKKNTSMRHERMWPKMATDETVVLDELWTLR